jgi:enterochelin esterase-like enzyme
MKRDLVIYLAISLLIPMLVCGTAGCSRDSEAPEEEVPFPRLLEDQSIQSEILNRPIHYAVLFPENYEISVDSYPVVYLLHGFGESETGWYKGGNIRYYIDQFAGETIPMIYVMPEGFNTYYVDKYNGNYPYMSMFVNELVPEIDSLFRTVKDPGSRAVMGYSMGGYGALILPVKNPEVFKTGVALSMSFRNDRQYMDEPQNVFDYQWGPVFGGIGTTGEQRLTDYFKEFSPFHFLAGQGSDLMDGIGLFIDCGDDEENLSETNNDLHALLRDHGISHEYRVRDGAHTWDYWHHALPEVLNYIAFSVQQLPYPTDPVPVDTGPAVPAERIVSEYIQQSGLLISVMLPPDYSEDGPAYPLIIVFHDRMGATGTQQMLSLISSNISANRLPPSLVVEVPLQDQPVSSSGMLEILEVIHSKYNTYEAKESTLLVGNGTAGNIGFDLIHDLPSAFNSCLLFDADLPQEAVPSEGVTYYLDISDKGNNFKSYVSFTSKLRENNVPYEHRVRNGSPSYESFLSGLDQASQFMKDHLKSPGI